MNAINTYHLEGLVTSQLRKYYPQRYPDYENNKLTIIVNIVNNQSDMDYFVEVKAMAGITDPECILVVGFREARIFLAPCLIDYSVSENEK